MASEPAPSVLPTTSLMVEQPRANLAVLRPDGLSSAYFGTPAVVAVVALTDLLGPADLDEIQVAPFGGFDSFPAIDQHRHLRWDRYGLGVELTDWGGSRTAPPVPLHLVMWSVRVDRGSQASGLRTADGVGIGTTAGELRFCDGLAVGDSLVELRGHHPQIGLGTFNVCEIGFDPATFSETPLQDRGLRGMTNWDWISDLQLALNERGASIANLTASPPRDPIDDRSLFERLRETVLEPALATLAGAIKGCTTGQSALRSRAEPERSELVEKAQCCRALRPASSV